MATWYVYSGAVGAGTGANFTNAYTTLAAALTAKAAGDTFYVAHDHAEASAANITMTPKGTSASPNYIICINRSTSALATTASIATTSTFNIFIQSGVAYFYGINFTNAGNGGIKVGDGSNSSQLVFDSCSFSMTNTTASVTAFFFGTSTSNLFDYIELINTTLSFGAATQSISTVGGNIVWRDTASALLGSALTTKLFAGATTVFAGDTTLRNLDLSSMTSGTLFAAGTETRKVLIENCAISSGVTIAATPASLSGKEVVASRVNNSGNSRVEKWTYFGTLSTETVIVRTGGASDGVTGISNKIISAAIARWPFPFEALPIYAFNNVTAANVTITLEGLQDPGTSVSLPNNDDVWFEASYLGSSSSPLGTKVTSGKASFGATNAACSASTAAWDSLVTARANSTVYALGAAIKLASNPGRVFICTTAGTSSSSEPGGYATAVDGGSVTDGTATFKAAVRFKMSVTLSSPQPGQIGALSVIPKVGKASATFYIDPEITLS